MAFFLLYDESAGFGLILSFDLVCIYIARVQKEIDVINNALYMAKTFVDSQTLLYIYDVIFA